MWHSMTGVARERFEALVADRVAATGIDIKLEYVGGYTEVIERLGATRCRSGRRS